MAKDNIASLVFEKVRPLVEEMGYSLWDVEYAKIGSDWNLTIVIDSPAGINITDCQKVHAPVGTLLDELDPIETSYILNVSSPGIERELRTEAHILACLGEKCEAKLQMPVDGQKQFKGILQKYENGVVSIQTSVGLVALDRKNIKRLRTIYFD